MGFFLRGGGEWRDGKERLCVDVGQTWANVFGYFVFCCFGDRQ